MAAVLGHLAIPKRAEHPVVIESAIPTRVLTLPANYLGPGPALNLLPPIVDAAHGQAVTQCFLNTSHQLC